MLEEIVVDLVKIDMDDVDDNIEDELFAENLFEGSSFSRLEWT